MGLSIAFRGKICTIGDTDFGHSSEFRGFRGQSLLGDYNCISSMWLSVGDALFRGWLLLGGVVNRVY